MGNLCRSVLAIWVADMMFLNLGSMMEYRRETV